MIVEKPAERQDAGASWRERVLILAGGGYLPGITLGAWRDLLRRNRIDVDPLFCLRAALITGYALQNSLVAWFEEARFSSPLEEVKIPAPIFILGAPRHGTTHLHNLFSADPRLASPNVFQVLHPQTFLTAERFATRLTSFLLPGTRPQDNVRFSFDAPHEEEIAMASATGLSPYLGFVFPKNRAFYRTHFDLTSASHSDLLKWKREYMRFLKKVTLRNKRRLVLKSPPNTSRISLLLSMFPDAKFVHIARHPFDVYRSSLKTIDVARRWVGLQGEHDADWGQELISGYRRLYEKYFQERSLPPDGALHEMKFEELERDPLGEMRRVYDRLGLGDFGPAESCIRAYVESVSHYRKNELGPLDDLTKRRVRVQWSRNFEEWGYQS